MPKFGRSGAGSRRASSGRVRGYTLRGKNGRIGYVGVTNNPDRRAAEHKQDGKRGNLQVETRSMSREVARSWESQRLAAYRRSHGGKNPPQNQTRSGGWKN